MKNYISVKTTVAGVVVAALVSVTVYFLNNKHTTLAEKTNSSSRINKAADNTDESTAPLQIAEFSEPVNSTEVKAQIASSSEQADDITRLEKINRVALTEHDLALPPPSGENLMAEATGEYSDQINPKQILKSAKSQGYFPPEVAPGSHPPSGNNIAFEPQDGYAREVNQQALIEKARREGYVLPEVAPDSHPPTGMNAASRLEGEAVPEDKKATAL
jgi:hypothetical protein